MSKTLSLIKATFTQDMNLFKFKAKKNSKNKFVLPIFLAAIIMFYMGGYTFTLMEQFQEAHLEYVALTLFSFVFCLVNIFEGLYKSSSLLFNCKDDQLLLSLPISKRMVLFIRMLKFYVFELLFNTMFLAPSMIAYAIKMNPSWTFYLVSIIALILFPIIPVLISSIIGFFMTYLTAKFKGKNIIQSVITFAILLVVLYYCVDIENTLTMIRDNALVMHNTICNIYYPVSAYMSMVLDFNIVTLLVFILIHIALFILTILLMGKFYFKLNSTIKSVGVKHNTKPYVIKKRSKTISFIKKEFSKFVYTPVFIVNAGFGLVMHIAACILVCYKSDAIINAFIEKVPELTKDMILGYIPVILLLLVCITSFMTSITSSMISLEGKKFYILKSLPIKSSTIVLYKVLAALVIMIPCILFGDIVVFVYFKLDILSILLITYASLLLPFISELIGIFANLKYPKMDASNDTEVVKQSTSSMVSVFIGMGLAMVSSGLIMGMLIAKIPNIVIMLITLVLFTIIALLLWLRLVKTAQKKFDEIQA